MTIIKKYLTSNWLFKLAAIASLPLFIILTKGFLNRVGAFGCFDDCHNYLAGYFMIKGRMLYRDIFYNHQPLITYLSFLIQELTRPKTLYHLILYHRLAIIIISFFFDLLLIIKFRVKGLAFALLYESTKFYLFGERFLPETIIPYIFVYLVGLSWEILNKKVVVTFDLLLSSLLTFIVVFLREPYVPAALFLFLFILFKNRKNKKAYLSLSFFIVLSLVFLSLQSLPDYFYNLVTANSSSVIASEIQKQSFNLIGILKILFYPIIILINGNSSILRNILVALDLVFLASISLLSIYYKSFKYIIFVFLILALNAIRYVEPGKMYYEAFHMLPWYAIFLTITLSSVQTLTKIKKFKKTSYFFMFILTAVFVFSLVSPDSFLQEKVNKENEFNTNYVKYQIYGDALKTLSDSSDKLFVEVAGEIVYFQSGLDSSYPYALYTPWTSGSKKYSEARIKMFVQTPPDFYYCADDSAAALPKEIAGQYLKLIYRHMDACLYVNKKTAEKITEKQWLKAESLGFSLSAGHL